MKHLKRFYENVNEELDIEYIKHCFADLSDDKECDVEYETHEDFANYDVEEYVDISIDIPRLTKGGVAEGPSTYHFQGIQKMIENSEKIAFILKWIDIAIKRLKDEYPNYIIDIKYEEDDDRANNYFLITITK